jgi:hypothetical protein
VKFLRVECALMAAFAVLTALTLVQPDWLEALGIDPDHGDGTTEWLIAAAFGAMTVVLLVAARRSYRKVRARRMSAPA